RKRNVFGVVAHDERRRMSIDRRVPHSATDREACVLGTHHGAAQSATQRPEGLGLDRRGLSHHACSGTRDRHEWTEELLCASARRQARVCRTIAQAQGRGALEARTPESSPNRHQINITHAFHATRDAPRVAAGSAKRTRRLAMKTLPVMALAMVLGTSALVSADEHGPSSAAYDSNYDSALAAEVRA